MAATKITTIKLANYIHRWRIVNYIALIALFVFLIWGLILSDNDLPGNTLIITSLIMLWLLLANLFGQLFSGSPAEITTNNKTSFFSNVKRRCRRFLQSVIWLCFIVLSIITVGLTIKIVNITVLL